MIDYEIFYEQFCDTISHTIYNNNRSIHICFILNIVNMYKRITWIFLLVESLAKNEKFLKLIIFSLFF